jgi:hypothetical protein
VSDVTAVVLSMGEPYVARALESVRNQTLPVADIVRVEHVSPFCRASTKARAGCARRSSSRSMPT